MGIIQWFRNLFVVPSQRNIAAGRSPHWPTVRKHFLESHGQCAFCGRKDKMEVHHMKPFHLDKSLELDPNNLITLCENGGDGCHFTFGHLFDWKAYNPEVQAMSVHWQDRIKNRKYE